MERMNYVRKRMQGGRRDKKELKVKEGDIINLMDLLFTENRDYLVKHSDDLKVCTIQYFIGMSLHMFSFARYFLLIIYFLTEDAILFS